MLIMNNSTWNWCRPKIIDSGKYGPNTAICSDFYEIWHSQQIEDAYYEHNTSQCLERSRIIGSKWLKAQNMEL